MRVARAASLAGACWAVAAYAAPVDVHPSGPSVPENLLRIELRFDHPQSVPFDAGRLRLLDASGREIPRALLDLTLPSADGRRVTVLLDPGRVKSGVGPNLDAGRALRAGETVSLEIDDARSGQSSVVKTWHVTPAQSRPLAVEEWRITAPRRGSREALVVDLRTPISSTGEALIAVRDSAGQRVPGRTTLGPDDAQWRFTPDRPWREARYWLVTHPDLEDPSGNRRCAPFEQARASEVRCGEGAEMVFSTSSRRRSPSSAAAKLRCPLPTMKLPLRGYFTSFLYSASASLAIFTDFRTS